MHITCNNVPGPQHERLQLPSWQRTQYPANAKTAAQVGLQLAERMATLVVGPGVAALQQRHPPAVLLSIALGPVPPEAAFADAIATSFVPTHLECEPSETFAEEGAGPWCSNFTFAGFNLGDGLLPIDITELPGPGWDGVVSVRPPRRCVWRGCLRARHRVWLVTERPDRRCTSRQ